MRIFYQKKTPCTTRADVIKSKISDLIEDIYKHNSTYLNHKKVKKTEIIQMVQKLIDKQTNNEEKKNMEEDDKDDEEYNIKNEDLNGLPLDVIKAKKKRNG